MKNLSVKIIVPLIAIGIMLNGCGIDNKEVYLAYKFDTGKKYHYVYDSQASYKAYENNKLVYAGDSTFKVAYVQETLENSDSAGARLRFTYTTNGKNNQTETWSTEYTMFPNGEITKQKAVQIAAIPEEQLMNRSPELIRAAHAVFQTLHSVLHIPPVPLVEGALAHPYLLQSLPHTQRGGFNHSYDLVLFTC